MASFARQTLELHGVFPDLIPQDAPANGWNQANNVYFEDGQSKRVAGDTPVFAAPTVKALGLVFYTNAAGEHFWVYATAAGFFGYDGTTHHNLTGTGWAPTSQSIVTMITYNGVVIANDSVSGPFTWNGSVATDFVKLPNWPASWRCISMRNHKAFLFAIGRLDTGGMQRVSWSDAAEAGTLPAAWQPAADNLAGFADLLPASSVCVDGVTVRDEFLVFKGETVHAFAFVGGNAIFSVRARFTNVGLAGVGGWAVGPNDQVLFLGADGDIYRTDGVSYVSILDGVAQRTFYEDSDTLLLGRVSGATLQRAGLSALAWPRVGEGAQGRALIYTWATGELSFRDMPQTTCLASGRYLDASVSVQNVWDTATGTWNSDGMVWNYVLSPATAEDVVAGSLAGFFLITGGETTPTTIPLPAYLLKQGMSFGAPDRQKLIARVWPKIEGTPGDEVMITVGGQDAAGGPVAWAAPAAHAIGSGLPVDVFQSGRFLALEVQAQGGKAWRLGTVDVEYRGLGLW